MKPKKIWANVGVSDLDRTRKFYTELGFRPNGHERSRELASFLFGEDDFIIHFFLKNVLQSNINGQLIDPKNGNEIIFSLSADSKEEVTGWVEKVRAAGGTIQTEFQEFGNGCFCVFSDPDGHKFNVLYWPG